MSGKKKGFKTHILTWIYYVQIYEQAKNSIVVRVCCTKYSTVLIYNFYTILLV